MSRDTSSRLITDMSSAKTDSSVKMNTARGKTNVVKGLKDNSVRIIDRSFNGTDIINAIAGDIGKDNILGCVKMAGQWIVTLSNRDDCELLQETGINISDELCDVMGVTRNIVTVSIFNVPTYIDDGELSNRLEDYGCKIKSKWTHKYYGNFPLIENGIPFVRLELPNNKTSLPYALSIDNNPMRLKHNGQTRVCNNCLGEDHIMRNCPLYTCRECGKTGHREAQCPYVRCYRCQRLGHKSFEL